MVGSRSAEIIHLNGERIQGFENSGLQLVDTLDDCGDHRIKAALAISAPART